MGVNSTPGTCKEAASSGNVQQHCIIIITSTSSQTSPAHVALLK